jgi:hypothetical protein
MRTDELEELRREGSREGLRIALADAHADALALGDRLWWGSEDPHDAAELGRLRRLADVLVDRLPTREARALDRLLGELAELATNAPAGGPIRLWLGGRPPGRTPDPEWLRVATAHEAIALLATGRVTDLSVCDELGDDEQAGTGSDVVAWLAQRGASAGRDLWPRATLVIHATSAGRSRAMVDVVDRFAPLVRVPGRPPRWRRRTR